MSRKILYLKGRNEAHRELLQAFESSGYRPVLFHRLEDLLESFRLTAPRAVVIDASANEAEAAKRIIEIESTAELFTVPVILFGIDARTQSKELVQQYGNFVPLDYPFRMGAFLARFQHAEAAREKADKAEPEEPGRHTLELDQIKLLDPGNLQNRYGGDVLAKADRLSAFNDELLLPNQPNREKIRGVLSEMTEKNKWLGIHARRSTFVSTAVYNSLESTGEQGEALKTASLLLNWTLADAGSRAQQDFLRSEQTTELQAVSDAFKMSAEMVRDRLGDEQAAQAMKTVAALVINQQSDVSEDVKHVADCVYLSELAGRACWKSGVWDHFGAQRTLRMLRCDERTAETEIAGAVARMLGEAVQATETTRAIFSKALSANQIEAQRQVYQAAMQDAREQFGNKETKRVKLFELERGMRLAAPLMSVDGQLILPANTVLDFDIIMRLLQLAAVRPIRATALVAK